MHLNVYYLFSVGKVLVKELRDVPVLFAALQCHSLEHYVEHFQTMAHRRQFRLAPVDQTQPAVVAHSTCMSDEFPTCQAWSRMWCGSCWLVWLHTVLASLLHAMLPFGVGMGVLCCTWTMHSCSLSCCMHARTGVGVSHHFSVVLNTRCVIWTE